METPIEQNPETKKAEAEAHISRRANPQKRHRFSDYPLSCDG